MVELARAGVPLRAIARGEAVSLRTVQRWVERAADRELDEVDWSGRSRAPRRTRHVAEDVEDEVIRLRQELRSSDLGDHGAIAIHEALGDSPRFRDRRPSVRTIGRILERRAILDGARRERRPAPPRGWYLPDLATHAVELDSFDVIEDRHIEGDGAVEVLTGISIHGGLAVAWPDRPWHGRDIRERLVDHWTLVGRPAYAQFDNDTRFHGSHGYPDLLGPVVRMCLALDVVPVFAPPREHGVQAAIEHFNGIWEERVWDRAHHTSLASLIERSDRFIAAHRASRAARIESAPERRPLPQPLPSFDAEPRGRLVFLRRTSDLGRAIVLGRSYDVDWRWPHRLVRAELDLTAGQLEFIGLRRRAPADQPLLRTHPYAPNRQHVHPCRRRREGAE